MTNVRSVCVVWHVANTYHAVACLVPCKSVLRSVLDIVCVDELARGIVTLVTFSNVVPRDMFS